MNRVLLNYLVAQRPLCSRREDPEGVPTWREVPDTAAPAAKLKIAVSPCQRIFFELYSSKPDEMQAGLAYGFKKSNNTKTIIKTRQ
jgi:hypothetical protein